MLLPWTQVGDMTRTTRLVDGIPTAEKDVQTVEFGILMKGGTTCCW